MSRTTISDLAAMKKRGEKWAMLTCYEQMSASVFEEAEIPVLLVGDSAGNNFLGEENTIPVTVDELIPLARAVVRGNSTALVIADFPFGSYEASAAQALETGVRFFKESKVQAVKLEGGKKIVPQIQALVAAGIPVMGHLGLTPQSVHALGGFKVQGRGDDAERIKEDARAIAAAGVFGIVLELVPAELAAQISSELSIPTIGIGAGNGTDAQVLVWTDLMGLTKNAPRFTRAYADLRSTMKAAAMAWKNDVATSAFPGEEETFH
jgi:3-methyl-2-oxobutanoate hydroxymethyltransferase